MSYVGIVQFDMDGKFFKISKDLSEVDMEAITVMKGCSVGLTTIFDSSRIEDSVSSPMKSDRLFIDNNLSEAIRKIHGFG